MSHLLQVGLLYGTFPSGSLVVLVGDRSEIGLGLLKRLLLVGLLSRGGGGEYMVSRSCDGVIPTFSCRIEVLVYNSFLSKQERTLNIAPREGDAQ